MTWDVRLSTQVLKSLRKLPQGIVDIFQILLAEMEISGPLRHAWPNYGKLSGKDCYHCHLQKGRPTYVAVWRVAGRKERIIEVIYLGTHERVNYRRVC